MNNKHKYVLCAVCCTTCYWYSCCYAHVLLHHSTEYTTITAIAAVLHMNVVINFRDKLARTDHRQNIIMGRRMISIIYYMLWTAGAVLLETLVAHAASEFYIYTYLLLLSLCLTILKRQT